MAINIDFYILPDSTLELCTLFICKLTEKAYKTGSKILIQTPENEIAEKLNDSLWTFRDISFIPHSIFDENDPMPAPVQIYPVGARFIAPLSASHPSNNILMNLDSAVPNDYSQFQRILEIVPNNPQLKAAARNKYKYYLKEGCGVNTHEII